MHNEIGHFGEAIMFVEVKKWFFQNDRTYFVKEFVKTCDKCQLVRQTYDNKEYVFVAIDHYFKQCEAHLVKEHDPIILARFFEDEIIC